MRRRKLRHRSASRPCSTSTSIRRSLANPDLEPREAVQDKAQELQDTEEHRELAILEEPQHISEPELRDFLEMEELDILGPAHTSEPELRDSPAHTLEPDLRDSLELEYKLEQEEVELRDSGRRLGLVDTSELELRDNGSPQSHELGVLPP